MADIATIDWAGLTVALLAVLGVIGNYLKTAGRTKYLTAITDTVGLFSDALAIFADIASGFKMIVSQMNTPGSVDPTALQAIAIDLEKQIADAQTVLVKIQTDLAGTATK